MPAPEPERPLPFARHAIFFDVENTSRSAHIARMIDHLAIDRGGRRTDFVAVGNWRVIGSDTARLLAGHGATLVHSAPAAGVRDWSDLRIAVSAGVWLATAHPGDILEIVSDDRAFDAVGDVAATLGIAFRRLSYRQLAGLPEVEGEEAAEVAEPERGGRRRRGRRGGRGRRAAVAAAPAVEPVTTPAPTVEPHTAPHDEIIHVVRELIYAAPDRPLTLDTLANALKSRGFSRPPGSPRLITRLRRIKEVSVDRAGTITLADGEREGFEARPPPFEAEPAVSAGGPGEPSGVQVHGEPGRRRRRRPRRGRRGRRRGGGGGPATSPA